jgi:predicted transcriptional regulator
VSVAARLMLQKKISGLPVVNDLENIVGVVSESDFLRRTEIGTGVNLAVGSADQQLLALDERECFIDATFVMAKGGGAEIGATKRGKGMKISLALSVSAHASNHREVRLVQL